MQGQAKFWLRMESETAVDIFIVAMGHGLAKLASTGGEFTLQMKRIAGNGVTTNPVHYRDE